MLNRRVLAFVLLSAAAIARADEAVFRITDPAGDDHGTGALLYPNRPDMQAGDLDLVAFSARVVEDGTWFDIEFARPIRDPQGEVTQIGQIPIERLARNHFYTFNIDIYVDQDRLAGSGRTAAVPGRKVDVDRNFAWEKAIVVSPRPDIARTLLELNFDNEFESELRARQGRVSKADVDALQARSQAEVADNYIFPDRIRVRGRRLEVFVPTEALGGTARNDWAYTVIVTGADIEQLGRVGFNPTGRPKMMTMPVVRGMQYDAFGLPSDADLEQSPVVDVLAPEAGVQEHVLDDYDTVAGRPAQIPGVAPDGRLAMAGTSGTPSTAATSARVDAAASPRSGAAGPVPPSTAAAPVAATTAPRTVPARLRTLNQLLEDGLITEAEYGDLRRKILAEL
jgi:C-terminal binding-module, SLH-like, of glucodextranase